MDEKTIYYTASEVAERLGVRRNRVYIWVRNAGYIPEQLIKRFGTGKKRRLRFIKTLTDKWLHNLGE